MSSATASFELTAEINGAVHDVARCEAAFTLNEIPRGSVAVAVGRDPNFQPATIHRTIKDLKLRQPVKIWLSVLRQSGAGLPMGRFLIFDGYSTGVAYNRSETQAEVVIGLEHWLADLAHGSILSPSSSPRNPAALIYDAVAPISEGGNGGDSLVDPKADAEKLKKDFWGEYLKPWFLNLAKNDTLFDTSQALQLQLGQGAQGNTAAAAALNRFEGPRYKHGVPLTLDPDVLGDLTDVAGSIHRYLLGQGRSSIVNATFWDKLLEFAADFMFAVVPMIDQALIVPLVPNLRSRWRAPVLGTEYSYYSSRTDTPRLLRGVAVYGGRQFETNGATAGQQSVPYAEFGVGGAFIPYQSGMLIYAAAPRWMTDLPLGWEMSQVLGINAVRGNARAPRKGKKPAKADIRKRVQERQPCLNLYAQYLYGLEVLKYRQASMSGRLRFDIGPGSIVAVDMVGDPFADQNDQLAEPIFACVTQASYVIDAENSRAGCSYQLTHQRAFSDAEDPGLTADNHPFWTKTWNGCPLRQGS